MSDEEREDDEEDEDDDKEEETPAPAAPVTVIEHAPQELTQPVIESAVAIARLEERQARHEEEMGRRVMEVEERINSSVGSRLSSIEERLTAALTPPAVPEVADIEEEVEVPHHKAPERRGIRGRRKARRGA